MMEMDFHRIASRLGGQRESFEELVCQLAHITSPKDSGFVRLHGAGGDGGVECFANLTDGSQMGWQAKYVFDIDALLTQCSDSLEAALKIHTSLVHYTICFPFDLTGPTGRHGRSGQEKFDNWRKEEEEKALKAKRQLTIEAWPSFKFRELLITHDKSGGIREYFFNDKILSDEWFSQHLQSDEKTAGVRYTPNLSVETPLWKWFAAFSRTTTWSSELKKKVDTGKKVLKGLASSVQRSKPDALSPAWPESLRETAKVLVRDIEEFLQDGNRMIEVPDRSFYDSCVSKLDSILSRLGSLESQLIVDLEATQGDNWADNPGFRQFMAEYMSTFPARNLDDSRDTIAALRDLHDWLCSPDCSLAFEKTFVLSGIAGSGKTHGVCDTAIRRKSEGLLTCIAFGQLFRGEPDPGTRLLESLGLSVAMGWEGVLDALNSAGEASGSFLMLCIDAINETRPLRYWHDRLPAFLESIERRKYLRTCITCRSSFLPFCLPSGASFPIVEHRGFAGIERYACQAFFQHYELEPPIVPILQPELSNPLYLKLVCETLQSKELKRLPPGWRGMSAAFQAFLLEKERQFSVEHERGVGASIVRGSLMAISRAIVESGETAISRSAAESVIAKAKPNAVTLPVLEWLLHADLLLEDAPFDSLSLDAESVVRPSFERLGDFLIASELLNRCNSKGIKAESQQGGLLYPLLESTDSIERNNGVLSVLAVLIPEQTSGLELPSLVGSGAIHDSLLRIAIRSLYSRDPDSFTTASQSLVEEALRLRGFSADAMDAILATCWQKSVIDAAWLDLLLKQRHLSRRDAFWCGYLHDRYESSGPVRRLIDAAFELPLNNIEEEVAERWAATLLWFTAAADRRVKDRATRGATAILIAKPGVLPSVLGRMLECDDDEVKERALLSSYGALIITRNSTAIKCTTLMLQRTFKRNRNEFDNALIRDDIRCICELAVEINAVPKGCNPKLAMRPIGSPWPLKIASQAKLTKWAKLVGFTPDEFLSDFFKYSMNRLSAWEGDLPKKKMGEWILQSVAQDFGFEGSGCENYDHYMRDKYGPGRSKPTWAERISKKYQWLAMYRLASRLRDHLGPKQDRWAPKPLRTPMILLEERKHDPTLSISPRGEEPQSDDWWITESTDPSSFPLLSDEEWISKTEDIPGFEKLLSIGEHGGQSWCLLVSYLSWGKQRNEDSYDEPYRQIWMHIQSYIVKKQTFQGDYRRLVRRNFHGNWMPDGADFYAGFVGEYPWATPFNTYPDSWHGLGGTSDDDLGNYHPAWNKLSRSWEYDASLQKDSGIFVPSKMFFMPKDLWWNGRDGYLLVNGRTVFRDPALIQEGTNALISDKVDLLERLDELGLRLIWTMLGEKWILGRSHDANMPIHTFSQTAYLDLDGSVKTGDRVSFTSLDKDTGLSVPKPKRVSYTKISVGKNKRTAGSTRRPKRR